MEHIYIKPIKKATIVSEKKVAIKNIAELQGKKATIEKIYPLIIMEIPNEDNQNYIVSVLDIIRIIQDYNPQLIVYNLGEKDTIISYKQFEKKDNKFFTFLKITFVAAVLISGSAVAIMAFHTDTQLNKVFSNFYFIFLGHNDYQPYLVEVPYAFGLALGISVFFNHFSKIKYTEDPTPIEVELKVYESQVEDSIIEELKNKGE